MIPAQHGSLGGQLRVRRAGRFLRKHLDMQLWIVSDQINKCTCMKKLTSFYKTFLVGKFRAALADIIPILPAIAHKLPGMLLVVYPILPQLLPHVGTVAPHLHVLLPHADFLTRIIPKLSNRIEDLIPLVEKVGPVFARLTPVHIEKLELIIDDVVDNLDLIAPHVDALMPVLEEGILVAPKVSCEPMIYSQRKLTRSFITQDDATY